MTGAAAQTIAGAVMLGVIILAVSAVALVDLYRAIEWRIGTDTGQPPDNGEETTPIPVTLESGETVTRREWAAAIGFMRTLTTCVGCGEDPATVAHPDGGPGGLCPACSTRGHTR